MKLIFFLNRKIIILTATTFSCSTANDSFTFSKLIYRDNKEIHHIISVDSYSVSGEFPKQTVRGRHRSVLIQKTWSVTLTHVNRIKKKKIEVHGKVSLRQSSLSSLLSTSINNKTDRKIKRIQAMRQLAR